MGVKVAPRAGAWIETFTYAELAARWESHPVRVRGLKLRHGDSVLEASLRRTPCGCVD